jgi:serine/threonine-protein kinase
LIVTASVPAREELAHVRIIRELGERTPGTYLGRREGEEAGDVVLETYANLDPKSTRLVFESARRMKHTPRHPHLVSVLACDRIGTGISIVTDFVDGLPLGEVFFKMSLGARLRAVVDILAALSALHITPDGSPIIHGGILLESSFAEKTGKTKLGFAYRRALCTKKESYAPEMLLGDEAAIDARTDVYGAGVLLWEAVNGDPLFGSAKPEDVVREQLAGRIAKPHVPLREKWASTVVPVVERALAIDPKSRYASVAEMAAALRIAVRARLMTHDDVIEELWPAETKPKHSSGIIPAAKPSARREPEPEPTFELELVAEPEREPEAEPEAAAEAEAEPESAPRVAELTMEPAMPAEGNASGIVPVAEPESRIFTAPLAPPPRSRVPFAAAIVVVISAVIAIGAVLVHLTQTRAQSSPVQQAVPTARPVVTEDAPRVATPPPAAKTVEDVAPTATVTTPAGTQVAPHKDTTGKPAKRKHGAYDPQSI